MKSYWMVLLALILWGFSSVLHGQVCYSPISAFEGAYSVTGTAQQGSCDWEPGATCTTNHSVTADVDIGGGLLSCSESYFSGTDSVNSASANDMTQFPCKYPDDTPGTETVTAVGSGSGFSASALTLNVAAGTYTYQPNATLLSINFTESGCDDASGSPGWQLTPVTNWPPTFALPGSPGTLSATQLPVTGLTGFDQNAQFLLTFVLVPIYHNDDDCNKNANSSIGCLNQSLREDIPIVGSGFFLHYESQRMPGGGGDPLASSDAAELGGWTLNVHHAYDPNTNILFLGDGTQRNGYQLGTPVSYNGNVLFTSEDGSEAYAFNATNGQHMQTLHPLTGALIYQFGYDSVGNLITVTDASGNVTTIQRNASEQPTAIVAPFGQTTMLSVDSNGLLTQVTDPLGNTVILSNGSTGLLLSRTDANGNTFNYTYDANGRLIKDADPIGGSIGASRVDATTGMGHTVTQTTSMGRTSTYQTTLTMPWVATGTSTFTEQRVNTWPDGLQVSSSKTQQGSQLTESVTLPDGTSETDTLGPDPVWGLQDPVEKSLTMTEGNLTMNVTGARTAKLGTVGNPFSSTTQTDTLTVNGRKYTTTFTRLTLKSVSKTPVGRTYTVGFDSLERVASTQLGALAATDYAYNSLGQVVSATQGTRTTTFTYGTDGFLASVTDPLLLTTSYTYDADGRLATTTLPDGRAIGYTYDNNGNLASITPPGKSTHDFAYTAVNLTSSYTPPTVLGTGVTSYAYDEDRELTTITRPDGQTVQFGYDDAGRLSSVTAPSETIAYGYDSNSGNLTSESINGGEGLSYVYNGPLPISSTLGGTVAGSVSRTYDDNFWVTSESINGGNTINFTLDNDGFTTAAGALTLTRNAKDAFVTKTALGGLTDTFAYNTFGEPTNHTGKYGLTTVFAESYTRDLDGRVIAKGETVAGKKINYAYTYDLAGRLSAVKKNGVAFSSYSYDSNSNRLSATTSSGTATATYDAQDRLVSYGNTSFTYTANGELATQTVGAQTTIYSYDVLGNLMSVRLPNGNKITYTVDPENRRVGKSINGALQGGFLYNDDDQIVAQLDASNQIVSQFVYATGSNSPDYMITGGVTYRIFSDHLGSPVAIVNSTTGAVAEQIRYDEFGNVLSDTSAGFQPFGFGGGLYDQDTKLVRLGARDYNPSLGRWTAKDPILFGGEDANLYGYAFDDPVNGVDPSGLECKTCKQREQVSPIVIDPIEDFPTDEVAKNVGKSVIKLELKTFGQTAEQRSTTIQKAIQDKTKPSPTDEYKRLQDELKKCEKSVNPFERNVKSLWIKVLLALQ